MEKKLTFVLTGLVLGMTLSIGSYATPLVRSAIIKTNIDMGLGIQTPYSITFSKSALVINNLFKEYGQLPPTGTKIEISQKGASYVDPFNAIGEGDLNGTLEMSWTATFGPNENLQCTETTPIDITGSLPNTDTFCQTSDEKTKTTLLCEYSTAVANAGTRISTVTISCQKYTPSTLRRLRSSH